MTKIIGLTGGIGSGKTTVAGIFRSLGVPVYIADEAARKITEKKEVIDQIVAVFGASVLRGVQIDREKLATLVFTDPEKLRQLNGIVHPAVKKDFLEWVENHRDHPVVIKEAAILFESGTDEDCDAVITVTAPIETRINRVLERDKTSREEVLRRIENQWTDAMRIAKSDFVIENVDRYQTERQVNKILKKLHNL